MAKLLTYTFCLIFSATILTPGYSQEPVEEIIEISEIEITESETTLKAIKIDCRETNPVNLENVADAYPFLSSDGLRLYFTSNREGGHGRFFISSRKTINDAFGEPVVLGKELVDGYYAGTLTGDELTLCMVRSGDVYISKRKSTKHEFETPVLVKGQTDQYHFGPAISPGGNEIIVTVTQDGTDVMKIYRRAGDYEFKEVGFLPTPFDDTEPGPGQFSKDGLSYYFSLDDDKSNESVLWRYSRVSLKDHFVDLEKLAVTINGLKRNFQPTVNGDGSIIVYVTSERNLWEDDDIVLYNDPEKRIEAKELFAKVLNNESGEISVKNKVVTTLVKAYPNPFQNNIIVELSTGEQMIDGSLFTLYDLSGKVIMQKRLTSSRTDISLSHMAAGTYVYQVINNKKKMLSSGKLVKLK